MKHEKACGSVIVKNGKVLLVYQQNGFWGFPKGHMEAGETEIETAIRETYEETGLRPSIDPAHRYEFSYFIKDSNIHKTVVLFLASLPGNFSITKQDSEIKSFAWVPLDEVEDTLTFPEWRTIWRQIYTDIQSETSPIAVAKSKLPKAKR